MPFRIVQPFTTTHNTMLLSSWLQHMTRSGVKMTLLNFFISSCHLTGVQERTWGTVSEHDLYLLAESLTSFWIAVVVGWSCGFGMQQNTSWPWSYGMQWHHWSADCWKRHDYVWSGWHQCSLWQSSNETHWTATQCAITMDQYRWKGLLYNSSYNLFVFKVSFCTVSCLPSERQPLVPDIMEDSSPPLSPDYAIKPSCSGSMLTLPLKWCPLRYLQDKTICYFLLFVTHCQSLNFIIDFA